MSNLAVQMKDMAALEKPPCVEGWAVRNVPVAEHAHHLHGGEPVCENVGPAPLDIQWAWRKAKTNDRRCSRCRDKRHRERHREVEPQAVTSTEARSQRITYSVFRSRAEEAEHLGMFLPIGRLVCLAHAHGTSIDRMREGGVSESLRKQAAAMLCQAGWNSTEIGRWMSIDRRTAKKLAKS